VSSVPILPSPTRTEKILARGKVEKPLGIVSLDHPQAGDCRREEANAGAGDEGMSAWQKCFEIQSQWFITWAPQVHSVDVILDGCRIDRVPVSIERFSEEWWLWWIPLPHVGGAPYTNFRLTSWIDSGGCRSVAPLN